MKNVFDEIRENRKNFGEMQEDLRKKLASVDLSEQEKVDIFNETAEKMTKWAESHMTSYKVNLKDDLTGQRVERARVKEVSLRDSYADYLFAILFKPATGGEENFFFFGPFSEVEFIDDGPLFDLSD